MSKVSQRKRKEPTRFDPSPSETNKNSHDDSSLPRSAPKKIKALYESAELLLAENGTGAATGSNTNDLGETKPKLTREVTPDDADTVISLLSLRQSTDRYDRNGSVKINTSLVSSGLDRYSMFPLDLMGSNDSSLSLTERSTSGLSSTALNTSTTLSRQKQPRPPPLMNPIKITFGPPSNGVSVIKHLANRIDPGALEFAGRPFMLQVAKHPPAKALYRRTLKPCPSVVLIHGDPAAGSNPQNRFTQAQGSTHNLLVEAVLIREDRYELPPEFLDGVRVVPLSPMGTATFKKLKIMSTSQQLGGTHLRIAFKLKKYTGSTVMQPVMLPAKAADGSVTQREVVALSNPIEVFSHSQYLNNKTAGVTEIIPPSGPLAGGTKVAILGYNFMDSKYLVAKFGDKTVSCQYHDENTLVCSTPPQDLPSAYLGRAVRVSVEILDTVSGFRSHIPAEFIYVLPRQAVSPATATS